MRPEEREETEWLVAFESGLRELAIIIDRREPVPGDGEYEAGVLRLRPWTFSGPAIWIYRLTAPGTDYHMFYGVTGWMLETGTRVGKLMGHAVACRLLEASREAAHA